MSSLTDKEKAELNYSWDFWARPNQKAPEGDWNTWLVLAGRGFGKTRMGSEWIRDVALKNPGCRIALVAETAADGRDVMILGDSGLIACDPNLTEDSWSPTNRRLTWPNGTQAWVYNATQPDQLRGPQHHFAWVDELAKFQYMQETWDQVLFGLRLGLRDSRARGRARALSAVVGGRSREPAVPGVIDLRHHRRSPMGKGKMSGDNSAESKKHPDTHIRGSGGTMKNRMDPGKQDNNKAQNTKSN